jgi:molybdenum cofactor cytidylyltransferase
VRTAAVILAAGPSTRLGFPKQLVRVNGVSLVRRLALSLCDAGIDKIGVVTGAWHSELEKELAGLDVEVIHNSSWKEGMSSSVACGAAWVDGLAAEHKGIFLATDQWKIASDDITNILAEYEKGQADVIGASYNGRWGMPLLVGSKSLLQALVSITSEVGFLNFMESRSADIVSVPMEHAAQDLDTPAQLMELSEHFDVTVMRSGSLSAI